MFNVYAQEYRQYIDEIPLGMQGENNARCLVVDITDVLNEFGASGDLEIRNMRPGESVPYIVAESSIISSTGPGGATLYFAKWVLDNVDTGNAGSGSVQIRYSINDVECFTWIYKYFLRPSIGAIGPSPSPYEDLLETMKEYADTASDAAQSAEDDATAAGQSATAAGASETAARGFAETAEAYAKGTVNGTPVTSGQTGYHDNAKYYKELAEAAAQTAVEHGYSVTVSNHKLTFAAPTP